MRTVAQGLLFLFLLNCVLPDSAHAGATHDDPCFWQMRSNSKSGEIEVPIVLLITEENAEQLGHNYKGPQSLPEGTHFSSWRAFDIFMDAIHLDIVSGSRQHDIPAFGSFAKQPDIEPGPRSSREERGEYWRSRTYYLQHLPDLMERSMHKVIHLGIDALFLGVILRPSVVYRNEWFGEPAFSKGELRKRMTDHPVLRPNADGSLTLLREAGRLTMLANLENSLAGRPLKVFVGQSRSMGSFLNLLAGAGSADHASLRLQLAEDISFDIAHNESWLKVAKEGSLTHLIPATLKDLRMYKRLQQQFKNLDLPLDEVAQSYFKTHGRIVFSTTRDIKWAEGGANAWSGGQVFEYEIDLSYLPEGYRKRIYLAPRGYQTPYRDEIDFPFETLDDARILARALRVVRIQSGIR